MKRLKEVPEFKNEDEEFEFWATHDTSEYVDMKKLKEVSFPNLKPTEGLIALFLDNSSANELSAIAKERSLDLATLAAQYVQEGIRRDANHARR